MTKLPVLELDRNVSTPWLTSVIIVAADSGATLVDCIGDVLANSPLEVLLSDNDSSDGSIEAVLAKFGGDTRLRVLRNGANLGFGAGVNRAARDAQGDALVLLNPDCRLAHDALARWGEVARGVTDLGVLGTRIVDAFGRAEPAARRRDPTLRHALVTLFGRDESGQGVNLPERDRDAHRIELVDAVSGAAMLMPRVVFDQLRGFDEGYFLHCEDLDLCRRARDAGYAVAYTDALEIIHAKGGSSAHRPVFVSWHKHRGMWRWFLQHDPAASNPLVAVAVWCGLWSHFALRLPAMGISLVRRRAAGSSHARSTG